MRITCPNCDAQYEVPDEVIPTEGRDVQCSNCGNTWYQYHPDHEPAEAAPEPVFAPAPGLSADEDLDEDETSDAPEMDDADDLESVEDETRWDSPDEDEEDALKGDDEDEDEEADPAAFFAKAAPDDLPAEDIAAPDVYEEDIEDLAPAPTPPVAPLISRKARDMDPSISDILRQEAEFEARMRATESTSLESQAELGLDWGVSEQPAPKPRERSVPVQETSGTVQADQDRRRSRLLPDIDEINSTLRTNETEAPAPEAVEVAPVRSRGGFTRGFSLILLLAVLLVVVYVNSQKIIEASPSLKGPLDSYTATVDDLRRWLDTKLSGFVPK
ncbi:zinc-ribbon domain-containing protein [Albibacillus kandeliae]|uniref:zinc-ribbon domain-containing protein n=1 Tax=Albibacillus kandeliae TaxID=2174228 RepID=UPI0018E57C4A|nr:zinc-ribbon domain-containing protein [Albibacillus kandeliae]